MLGPRYLIPSTSMLVAFEAAARTGSFTSAAKELHLSQGAISRQIAALEARLGIQLFVRSGKIVTLSDAGKIYLQDIAPSLQNIRNASLNIISNPLGGFLNLAILPTFGMRWLMPRFPDFLKNYPHITVNFASKLSPFNFRNENLHAAIHFGQPDWPDTEATFIMSEEVVPVASPKLVGASEVLLPEDIVKLPLLHLETRPDAWKNWFSQNNLMPPVNTGTVFEQFAIVTQAAIAGMGAALLPKFLIEPELVRGDLLILNQTPLVSEDGYYLVSPTHAAHYAPVVSLRTWLLQQV